jgi:hypothetical protein
MWNHGFERILRGCSPRLSDYELLSNSSTPSSTFRMRSATCAFVKEFACPARKVEMLEAEDIIAEQSRIRISQ